MSYKYISSNCCCRRVCLFVGKILNVLFQYQSRTVQELVVPNALYVMTTSILERIINTWILRLKLKPGTSEMFLIVSNGTVG